MSDPSDRRREQRFFHSYKRADDDWHQVIVAVIAGVILMLITNFGQFIWSRVVAEQVNDAWQAWADGANRNYEALRETYTRPAIRP
jgi:hypothetical protein